METHSKVKVLNLLWFDCDNNNDKNKNKKQKSKIQMRKEKKGSEWINNEQTINKWIVY